MRSLGFRVFDRTPGQNANTTLADVWAPGTNTGKTLQVQPAVTNAAALQAQLKGGKTLTKQVSAGFRRRDSPRMTRVTGDGLPGVAAASLEHRQHP